MGIKKFCVSKLFFLISICSWSQVNVLIDNNVKDKQMYSNINTAARPFKLIVNGKEIQNVEMFSVDKSNLAIKQKFSSDTVFFTCENFKNCYFLLRHNKKKSLNGAFPGDLVSNGEYIHIYYDSRLFRNLIREKFMKGSLFFFSRHFIVDIGHDNIYIERKNKFKKITPP